MDPMGSKVLKEWGVKKIFKTNEKRGQLDRTSSLKMIQNV